MLSTEIGLVLARGVGNGWSEGCQSHCACFLIWLPPSLLNSCFLDFLSSPPLPPFAPPCADLFESECLTVVIFLFSALASFLSL